MGCDGGTIPTRGELVKTKKKPEQLAKETELAVRWLHCALSQEPLRQPVVACRLGFLYNKESLIEYLLTRTTGSQQSAADSKLDHIRGLKDIKELRLAPNPAYREDSDTKAGAGSMGERGNVARFICPVTGLEMNGRFRFSYLSTCGCVLAERALLEVKDTSSSSGGGGCLQCGRLFNPRDDVIPINGDAEEVEKLREKLVSERNSARAGKKNKRSKVVGENGVTGSDDDPVNKKQKEECNAASASGVTSSKSTNSEQEPTQNVCSKDSSDNFAAEVNGTKNGLCSKTKDCGKSGDKGKKLLKNGSSAGAKVKSIQDDASATEAYKSLFNTHPTALKQGKAHWVTYNPQYN